MGLRYAHAAPARGIPKCADSVFPSVGCVSGGLNFYVADESCQQPHVLYNNGGSRESRSQGHCQHGAAAKLLRI